MLEAEVKELRAYIAKLEAAVILSEDEVGRAMDLINDRREIEIARKSEGV
jgi:hypothetical protein